MCAVMFARRKQQQQQKDGGEEEGGGRWRVESTIECWVLCANDKCLTHGTTPTQ